MSNSSSLSEQQQHQCQVLRAFNYSMHRAGLTSIYQAEPIRKEIDVKLFTWCHRLNPMRICSRCGELLQDNDPSNNGILIMHNKPECRHIFHEKCFLDFQRIYSACPSCKPEYENRELRRVNEEMMHDIECSADTDAEINQFFEYARNIWQAANESDRKIMWDIAQEFTDEWISDHVEVADASANIVSADELKSQVSEANLAFSSLFPHGYDTIPTSGADFLCALRAICLSLQALANTNPSIPVPNLEDLQEVTRQWEWRSYMSEFGVNDDLMNESYFGVDQAALAAQMWAEKHHFAIRFGYVIPAPYGLPGDIPYLLPYSPLSSKRLRNANNPLICFIFNNNVEAEDETAINHFEGMCARSHRRGLD